MSILSKAWFHNETAAYEWLEAVLWPNGPTCPHCGATDRIYTFHGKAHRIGVKKCGHCRKQFTVKVGTVFESSHVPLHKWLQAVHLLCSSKKGISSHQLHRILEVTYKTAWFMSHRIREAMRDGSLAPLGGNGKVVEADETFLGDKGTKETRPGWARGVHHKRAVVSLVERGGKVRSIHADRLSKAVIGGIVRENVDRESRLMTDEARHYHAVGREFAEHGRVEHGAGIYVDRTDPTIHTNTAEGFFGLFKRGMKGVYHHCGEKHLHRYLAEFDFRYNHRTKLGVDDSTRAAKALEGIKGKRLTYRRADGL
jgi:transposase-like protein